MRCAVIVACFAVSLGLPAAAGAASEKSESSFQDLVRGAAAQQGFLDIYEKGDHLYLAVPADRLGRDMVLVPRLERGVGAAGLFGGLLFDRQAASIVAFERHGDRVFLIKRAHRFTAPAGSPEATAVALSIGESVLQSAPVAATRDDGAAVIDVYDWMVADLSNIDKLLRTALGTPGKPGRGTLAPHRHSVECVKALSA